MKKYAYGIIGIVCVLGFGVAYLNTSRPSQMMTQEKEKEGTDVSTRQEVSSEYERLSEEEKLNETYNNLLITEDEEEAISKELVEIGNLYKELYKAADKGKARNVVLKDETVKRIMEQVATRGCVVREIYGYYPMENWRQLDAFCKKAQAGVDAHTTIYTVTYDGGIIRTDLCAANKELEITASNFIWDEKMNVVINDIKRYKAIKWAYTDKGYLLYQEFMPSYMEATGITVMRVVPLSEECRDLLSKYIAPIGYQGNNLFLTNWREDAFGEVDFNDLFEYLYQIKYQEKIGTDLCKDGIDNEIFEDIVQSYFKIDRETLRQLASYDRETERYNWFPIGCANYSYDSKGVPTPEVTAAQKNEDGTITLTVEAVWEGYFTDCAFTHKVTIREGENGSFQYVANEIISDKERICPRYKSRNKVVEQYKQTERSEGK